MGNFKYTIYDIRNNKIFLKMIFRNSHIGHPVVGDVKYNSPNRFRDLALHSYLLEFPHPTREYMMSFYCYPPVHWTKRFGPDVMQCVRRLFPKDVSPIVDFENDEDDDQ